MKLKGINYLEDNDPKSSSSSFSVPIPENERLKDIIRKGSEISGVDQNMDELLI